MPADVLLMLCSSGIALVASLVFFVRDERPPADRPGPLMTYALPPVRADWTLPPRLPTPPWVDALCAGQPVRLTLNEATGEWTVSLSSPLSDSPAQGVWAAQDGSLQGVGQVHDLRWAGRAGLTKPGHRAWRRPAAKA